jgi:hypothetical protein
MSEIDVNKVNDTVVESYDICSELKMKIKKTS